MELGRADLASRFMIPQRLYGREAESARLFEACEDAASGRPGLVLISGRPGVGKTSLAFEIDRRIAETSGYFASGRFQEIESNGPFSGWIEAFGALCERLMIEEEAMLAGIKASLREKLGPSAPALAALLPSLVRVLGDAGPSRELSGSEARNRILDAFRSFAPGSRGQG